jgi:hypothetical protein
VIFHRDPRWRSKLALLWTTRTFIRACGENRTGEKFKTWAATTVRVLSIFSTSEQLVDILFDDRGLAWYKNTKSVGHNHHPSLCGCPLA